MVVRKKKTKRSRTGEDYLRDVEAITITLENGKKVELTVADEVYIPTDPDEMVEALRRSAAKLAFWSYQTERALEEVRKAEMQLAQNEGRNYDLYRVVFTDEIGVDPTESMLRAKLDQDQDVRVFRLALRRLRKEYGLLRGVRDAVDRRDSALRTLIHRYEP